MRYTTLLLGLSLTTLLATVQAQTCNTAVVADAPDSRYLSNTNGTVLDKETGLIWKRCAEGQTWTGGSCTGSPGYKKWSGALQTAESHVFAGKSDWRLPNKKELGSLVERRCYEPAINLTAFPNASGGRFWSSSPDAYNSYDAWIVFFGYYGHDGGGSKSQGGSYVVRLVRAGQ